MYPSFQRLQDKLSKATHKDYSGHREKVHTIDFNSDGSKIASGSIDKTARVHYTDRSVFILNKTDSIEFRGHTDTIDQLVWDPSHPDKFATASADKTVRIWDIRMKDAVHVVNTPGENINISWSPDGKCIAVGNKEDTISFIDPRSSQESLIFKAIENNVEVLAL